MAYVIRHPDSLVLFDTGFGFGNKIVDDRYHPNTNRVRDVLAEHGIDPGDLTAVINCHLHIDHAGQNRAFHALPIHTQRAEWEAAHDADYTILEWIDFPNAAYVFHDGDYELRPGLRVLATPGHTPGHQSVVVETDAGPVVLAGQAVYSHGEWVAEAGAREGRSRAWNVEAYDESVQRLRDVRPVRVHFGHDREVWSARS